MSPALALFAVAALTGTVALAGATPAAATPVRAAPNAAPGNAAPNAAPGNAAPNAAPGNAAPNAAPGNAAPNAAPGNAAPGNAAPDAAPQNAGAFPAAAPPVTGTPHPVTYDDYSFMVDGKRVYLWAGEFHYFRLPSPALWRDILLKLKAGGHNTVSYYFDWAYHSPKRGVYDFTGIRDIEQLFTMAEELGMYVIARPGPYINAEIDLGGMPAWLTTQKGRARSNDPEYLKAADEWLDQINPMIARHQLTNGTGTVISYQVENEFYDTSAQARQYMEHLKRKARADGITVPLVGNHNNNYNAGVGALDVDMPDAYPQGFNCSNPTVWKPVTDLSWGRFPGKPLGIGEFQGGAFDPWGGPGYDACRKLTGPEFEKVFYKQNIAIGVTQQSFYMTYGGTSWGWTPDPSQVYSSYDYGAAITEGRQLSAKYDENKRIGYFTQAVTPLTKTDALSVPAPKSPAISDLARINPDTRTQFHTLRHADSTSTATDSTTIALDLNARAGFTHDDRGTALTYTGTWEHAGPEQNYTGGDYKRTESFSRTAGDSVTVPFTGSAVRWISSKDPSHGIADVYLDGAKVATVDTYAAGKQNQQALYEASGLSNGRHTLMIVVTGRANPAATAPFVVVDAIDVPTPTSTGDVYPTVPQQPGTSITFAGRDSKIIVANYALGAQRLQYSTSEIMTHAQIGHRDVALFYGRNGQDGETVLRYAARPTVTVLDGDVQSTWDASRGDLRLNYKHTGLARVLVTGGARPLLLLLATDEVAATFWQQQTASGPILVRGPYLVRSNMGSGTTLGLRGDTAAAGDLEVFTKATTITWNGRQVKTTTTPSGSRLGPLAGPRPVTLPALNDWKHSPESPESEPGFDDSRWTVADKTASNSITAPVSLPVLFADDYGYHHGDVWYRGRFTGAAAQTGINLSAITGRAGLWSVWLNGKFLGSSTAGQQTFPFPAGAVRQGAENVLSVLVENMGHNEDYNENDWHKQARGLTGASLVGNPFGSITWRIQGARGGEDLFDKARGSFNNGGLYGERAGWSLPGFPDSRWATVKLPHADTRPGVSWYRTTARLDLPRGQDTSVGLRFDDPQRRHYRTQIFVNGWLLGRYVADVGPQKTFPIPNGILNPNGVNTIALAVWNADTTTGGLGKVSLESYGSQLSPQQTSMVNSPAYAGGRYTFDPAPRSTVRLTGPDTLLAGESFEVSAEVGVPVGAPVATGVSTELGVPAGWTATASTPTTVDRLAAGASATVRWRVTAPAAAQPAVSVLTATVRHTQAGRPAGATDSRVIRLLPTPPRAAAAVSDLPFLSARNEWGPVERNLSNGESAAGDGRPITIAGKVYASGLGVHAPGEVALYLGGRCSRFTAVLGIDDEVGSAGSVRFSVVADGRTVYTSPMLLGTSAGLPVDVDITGAQVVTLVTASDDRPDSDHADWADARVACR